MEQTPSITLLDGRVLTCFESEAIEPFTSNDLRLDTTGTYMQVGDSAIRSSKAVEAPPIDEHKKLFLTYFQTFFYQRERILSDSRMFLTRIPMYNGLAYTGTSGFNCPTLGVLIEWLLNAPSATVQDEKGRVWMVSSICGSPLSGSNNCVLVDGEGNTCSKTVNNFASLWRPFMEINKRYDYAKAHYQHYTLEEVVNIFAEEGRLTLNSKEITIFHLNNQIVRLKEQIEYAKERDEKLEARFHKALMKRHFEQMSDMVAELEQKISDSEKRIDEIYALRADLRKKFKKNEIAQCDYQQQLDKLESEKTDLMQFCQIQSTEQICNTLFDGEHISLREMQQFIKHHPQAKRNSKLTRLIEVIHDYLTRQR